MAKALKMIPMGLLVIMDTIAFDVQSPKVINFLYSYFNLWH